MSFTQIRGPAYQSQGTLGKSLSLKRPDGDFQNLINNL
jgi:hypothetical protein